MSLFGRVGEGDLTSFTFSTFSTFFTSGRRTLARACKRVHPDNDSIASGSRVLVVIASCCCRLKAGPSPAG